MCVHLFVQRVYSDVLNRMLEPIRLNSWKLRCGDYSCGCGGAGGDAAGGYPLVAVVLVASGAASVHGDVLPPTQKYASAVAKNQ